MLLEIVGKLSELNYKLNRDLMIRAIKEPSRFGSDGKVSTGND